MANSNQPIFILPEGTNRSVGRDAQRNNILAGKVLAETVRTTLGPKGMDKMLVDGLGDIVVTNDGVTILKEMDIESAIISAGGNVESIGKPLDNDREKWGIGLQNPIAVEDQTAEKLFDVVFANDKAVVTSGDYQRYYTVGDKRYHHIIDPDTLMPADYYRAVTVVADNSGVADFMSTTLFILPLEEGKALAEKAEVDVLWYMKDNSTVSTLGMDQMLKNKGASAE